MLRLGKSAAINWSMWSTRLRIASIPFEPSSRRVPSENNDGRRLRSAALVFSLFAGLAAGQPVRLRPLPDLDKNVKTGPAVGSAIPAFRATDQNGRERTFETLRGERGLALLFFRSADW